jgi:hypothetical protein
MPNTKNAKNAMARAMAVATLISFVGFVTYV